MTVNTDHVPAKPPYEPHRARFLEIAETIRRRSSRELDLFDEAMPLAYRLIMMDRGTLH